MKLRHDFNLLDAPFLTEILLIIQYLIEGNRLLTEARRRVLTQTGLNPKMGVYFFNKGGISLAISYSRVVGFVQTKKEAVKLLSHSGLSSRPLVSFHPSFGSLPDINNSEPPDYYYENKSRVGVENTIINSNGFS